MAKLESRKDIKAVVRFLITGIRTYNLLILSGLFLLSISVSVPAFAQAPNPEKSILELREGYLLVRMPASRSKIDTLKALTHRTVDPVKKARLERMLREAIEQRDSLLSDYVNAFKNQYRFSKVAYFMDFDGHHPSTATYYNLERERIPVDDLNKNALFYLYFERTDESKVDALVIYDRTGERIPAPFPNNFYRGGLNFLFLKISDKNFPAWRVGKINKQLFRYWNEVRSEKLEVRN